jgi:hypothetical protein
MKQSYYEQVGCEMMVTANLSQPLWLFAIYQNSLT